jgi:hypothetical protein
VGVGHVRNFEHDLGRNVRFYERSPIFQKSTLALSLCARSVIIFWLVCGRIRVRVSKSCDLPRSGVILLSGAFYFTTMLSAFAATIMLERSKIDAHRMAML